MSDTVTPTPARYRVAQTDCRTGWQVLNSTGRPVPGSTFRRREHADALARDLASRPIGGPRDLETTNVATAAAFEEHCNR